MQIAYYTTMRIITRIKIPIGLRLKQNVYRNGSKQPRIFVWSPRTYSGMLWNDRKWSQMLEVFVGANCLSSGNEFKFRNMAQMSHTWSGWHGILENWRNTNQSSARNYICTRSRLTWIDFRSISINLQATKSRNQHTSNKDLHRKSWNWP